MLGHRIIRAAALTASMLCLPAASASASSTLLSGYGGPGQGNQAIIGSTLIGGGSGGGSGSGSTGTPTGSAPASIALPQASAGKAGSGSARSRKHSQRHAGKPSAPAKTTGAGGAQRSAPAAARSGEGGTLGLTGADVLYAILAFCVLAATAVLTSRLTGRTGRAGGTR